MVSLSLPLTATARPYSKWTLTYTCSSASRSRNLPWGAGRPLRIATISWRRVTSPPVAGMAELSWYPHFVPFEVDSAFSSRNFLVLESCICPYRNRMKQDYPAFRNYKLLTTRELYKWTATKQWTLGCTWFLVAG